VRVERRRLVSFAETGGGGRRRRERERLCLPYLVASWVGLGLVLDQRWAKQGGFGGRKKEKGRWAGRLGNLGRVRLGFGVSFSLLLFSICCFYFIFK
jgi:hypothetical protein